MKIKQIVSVLSGSGLFFARLYAQRRITALIFFVALGAANCNSKCLGSIALNMTGGFVTSVSSSTLDVTLFGRGNQGEFFVFTAAANFANLHDLYAPGGGFSPNYVQSGLDLRAFSLTIDGDAVDIFPGGGGAIPEGSSIEIDGPSLTLPNVFVPEPQTLSGPVNFNLDFNLYEPEGGYNADLLHTITGNGLGLGIFDFNPDYSHDVWRLDERSYVLGRVIPEPSSTALLGVCLIGAWMRRRR